MDNLMVGQNYRYCQAEDRKCVGRAVNEEVAGSNPAPATNYTCDAGWSSDWPAFVIIRAFAGHCDP